MAVRYSRRSARKRRRRFLVIAVASGALLALAAGGVLVSKFGLPSFSISGNSTTSNNDRFDGLSGIVIPEHEKEELWWTSINLQDLAELPAGLGGTSPDSRFSRMLIPSDVLFAPESNKLNDAAKQSVVDIAATITSSQAKVIVVCHSSSDGRVERRLPLSEERADALASALEVEMHRAAGSIERIGLGASSPLPNVDASTPTGRVLNRRCEVYVEILG